MTRALFIPLALALLPLDTPAAAQQSYNADWMWLDQDGEPVQRAWFRHEVRSTEPSTGAVRIIADDRFTLWVNGQKVGEGQGAKLFRFNLNGIVERGPNVIAVEAENAQGTAGLFIDGEVRTQTGQYIPFDGGPDWRATTQEPAETWVQPGFDTSAWAEVSVLGPHADSPWKDIELKESYLDRFELAEGFELKRIAEPDLVGSLVAFTWGNSGRLLASRERGPVLTVTDTDGDGTYDTVAEYTAEVKSCQGLCMVGDDLFAIGDGPKGPGLYRLPDKDDDGAADEVVHLLTFRGGMGEHGPHAIVLGPDGWLYLCAGNHAWVPAEPEPTTAVRNYYEGDVLKPRFEDARGHAVGIPAPGGTIWRFSPDGKQWYCETAGFRNEYDLAFNLRGDLFSFDSDMEWDVGLPWYRPVRVNHCIPGAEFGWRSGAANWPEYYFDSLPGTVDIGRGSPTGVVFYDHRQFPEKYRGAFLVCDWSMGRLMAVHLEPKGASYAGAWENIVTGNPLNVADIEVDRDGSVVFCTGGRGTEGGIYRVTYAAGDKTPAKAASVEDLLTLPQMESAWSRETVRNVQRKSGKEWAKLLQQQEARSADEWIQLLTIMAQSGAEPGEDLLVMLSKQDDPRVRAFATFLLGSREAGPGVAEALVARLHDDDPTVRRRACEAFVRTGITPPVEPLVKLLSDEDHWLRFAARLALERVPVGDWIGDVLNSEEPWVVLNGMLAIYRSGADSLPPDAAFALEWDLLRGVRGELDAGQRLAALRMTQLTLIAAKERPEAAERIGHYLLQRFPTGDLPYDAEAARLLAMLQVPGAAAKLVDRLENAPTQSEQIHYALVLTSLDEGWTAPLKSRVLRWYESTQAWEGGHSMQPYLANIVGHGLKHWTPRERGDFLKDWAKSPFAAALVLRQSEPREIAGFESVIDSILASTQGEQGRGRDELVALAIQGLGRNDSPDSRGMLRRMFEEDPDRRDVIARAIAERPTAEDWPQLIRTLQFGEPTTLQLVLGALSKLNHSPERPDEIRAAILAGLKLGPRAGGVAVKLLEQWTGAAAEKPNDVAASLAQYQAWYAEKFPDAPPAELAGADPQVSKYAYDELVKLLDSDPRAAKADPQRGRKLFADAKCVKCHRFGNEGDAIGPDLTSLRRRFQRKEIVESIVAPSQVISDQYRMVTVLTKEGLVHNGMPVPNATDADKVTLLLSDATRLEIPRAEIDELAPSRISVMPAGLLNDLSPDQIADLFAFLETSKFNEPTSAAPRSE